jgi:hypothetical protein
MLLQMNIKSIQIISGTAKSKMNLNKNYNNNTESMSIYIPRMSVSTTEKEVMEIFHKHEIGQVRRVDFTSILKKPGFNEISTSVMHMKSAFVHFNKFYDNNHLVQRLLELLNNNQEKCVLYLDDDKRSYWILLKALTVIPDTMMNHHQIVENCRYLEKKIEEQEITIKNYEERIQNLEKCITYFINEKQMSEDDNDYQDNELKMIKNLNSKRGLLTSNYDYSYDIADDEDSLSVNTTEDSINL